MKILLVDDSKLMRNAMRKHLSTLPDCEFTEAGDGAQGLAAIQAAGPGGFDIVLVDWNMPTMDGLTMVKNVRELDKKTPLVMVTTEGEASRVIEAVRAGTNNYVVKPFTPEVLIEKINATIAKLKAAA